MKQRILFILISVLFIFGMLGHHFSNRTFVFGQDYWTVDLGERQEDRYVSVAFPRFLYKMAGQMGWRQMIKANGGKAKDLGRQPE